MNRTMWLISILLLIGFLMAQKIESKKTNGRYYVEYSFYDQWDTPRHISLSFDVQMTEKMNARFGFPVKYLRRQRVTQEEADKMDKRIEWGFFAKREGERVGIDYGAAVSFYAPIFCQPIADSIRNWLKVDGLDTDKNRIEMAMRFVQEIPYGEPPVGKDDLSRGQAFTPPEVLIVGYGDCDSKAILFAGILCYLIDFRDILFVEVPSAPHVAVFIETSRPAKKKEVNIKKDGRHFLIADTAGPALLNLGQADDDKICVGRKARIYSLLFEPEKYNTPAY